MQTNPFETDAATYDDWYDEFTNTFRSELLALETLLPTPGRWIEIGVGTGRFAEALGIPTGIEPADGMAVIARRRGIDVIRGCAESLPLESGCVDAVFFITTLCFVQDVSRALSEAFRVLTPGGACLAAMLPLESALGQVVSAHADSDAFFRSARLRTRREVLRDLRQTGFTLQASVQTLCGSPRDFEAAVQAPQPGIERGSFVVVRAVKQPDSCSTQR